MRRLGRSRRRDIAGSLYRKADGKHELEPEQRAAARVVGGNSVGLDGTNTMYVSRRTAQVSMAENNIPNLVPEKYHLISRVTSSQACRHPTQLSIHANASAKTRPF